MITYINVKKKDDPFKKAVFIALGSIFVYFLIIMAYLFFPRHAEYNHDYVAYSTDLTSTSFNMQLKTTDGNFFKYSGNKAHTSGDSLYVTVYRSSYLNFFVKTADHHNMADVTIDGDHSKITKVYALQPNGKAVLIWEE